MVLERWFFFLLWHFPSGLCLATAPTNGKKILPITSELQATQNIKKNKTTRIHDTFSPWTFFGDFVQRKVMHNQQIKHWCLSLLRFWNSATAASDIYTGVSLYKQLTPHATVPTFNVSLSIRLYQRSSSVGSTDSNQSTSIFTILQSTSSSLPTPHFSHYFTHDLLWNKHF